MYTDEHIASLLAIIAEQRTRITKLEADLTEAKRVADRNFRWFSEEEEKSKALAEKLNQPQI